MERQLMAGTDDHLTEKVIGCAYSVYNTMGFGFLENVYEHCLEIELQLAHLQVDAQAPIKVTYKGSVGHFQADLFVEGRLIVELKSVKALSEIHEVQLVNYLVATDTPVGLLINFGPKGVEVRRKVKALGKRGTSRES